MTRPLFLLPPGGLDGVRPGQDVRLDGEEGRHASGVRRIRPGEQVDVGDGAGRVAGCDVLAAGRDGLRLRVVAVNEVAPASPRLVLVQALARGGRDEQAIETATELGVDAVVPWQAGRSVVHWHAERASRGVERWRAVVRAATKQSRRAWLPLVHEPVDSAGLTRLLPAAAQSLLLHAGAPRPLSAVDTPPIGDVLVVAGPEGGIEPGELAAFEAAGAVPVRLGPTVLRSSSAGPAALAVLAVRTGRW